VGILAAVHLKAKTHSIVSFLEETLLIARVH